MKNHISLLLLFAFTAHCFAQISEKEVDALAEKTLKTFNIPGVAVAIVKDGKVILSKGYGVRSIKTNQKVDANTLFGIASNSKAFTTAALAILVDEGKVNWDDKVVKYIPEFKMYNDYVTNEFTVRDLLTHRSGLGLGAGDLMIWPDGSDFTATDIIHNLQFLKPVSAFRTKFDYDNLLYAVAGKVIEKVSGKSWTDFIEQRIMQPLQMKNSAGSYVTLKDTTNVIAPHVPVEGKLKVVRRYTNQTLDAAGGIYSSVNDMSQWMIMQLNKGKYGPALENKIFSAAQQQEEMWQLQTIIPATTKPPYNSHFSGYGLGWFLSDMKGYKEVTHTGGLEGIVTQVTLYPELNLGIVVLTNQQAGRGLRAITNTIKNSYLGIEYIDYVEMYAKMLKEQNAGVDQATAGVWETVSKNTKGAVDFKKYTGTYTDNWFGDIVISEKNGKLFFNSKRSPQLAGEIFYYKDTIFAVKWNNRSFDADAFMTFSENNTNIKMKPISEATDFSYDFQDLDFKLVKK